jgi:hypothetical protein
MAINFKKGPALSLGQADKVAKLASSQTVIAGQVVRINSDGTATLGVSGTPASDLVGFSLNTLNVNVTPNTGDGDAINIGSVGIYLLDGGTVVEVDSSVAALTINSTNYVIGAPVYANTSGLITTSATGAKQVGVVEGIRNLPNTAAGSNIGTTTAFLGIKLIAA